MRVLDQARSKVEAYDKFDNDERRGKYNRAYRDLLRARGDNPSLVDETGGVNCTSISLVEDTLIAFEMKKHGQMNEQFRLRLKRKLEHEATRAALIDFRALSILSSDLVDLESNARHLFERLAERDEGLDARGYRFGVGAAKIMNFLYPELFVLMDSLVLKGLGLIGIPDFGNYWSVMTTCHNELRDWQNTFGNLDNLICLDQEPTTLTRIFDKCAFVMGLERR